MKKILTLLILLLLSAFIYTEVSANGILSFSTAVKTCEKYAKSEDIERNGEIFNISVVLEKNKNNKCTYKEKISQGSDWELLTCNFEQGQLNFISNSMLKFSQTFAKQIAKEPIFEAKMTTNGEIFQKYLANPKYCTITHSKK